jgi:hypothetical protein
MIHVDAHTFRIRVRARVGRCTGRRALGITHDQEGLKPWLTLEQAERAARQAEHAALQAERAAKEVALRRVAELEAEIARRRG